MEDSHALAATEALTEPLEGSPITESPGPTADPSRIPRPSSESQAL